MQPIFSESARGRGITRYKARWRHENRECKWCTISTDDDDRRRSGVIRSLFGIANWRRAGARPAEPRSVADERRAPRRTTNDDMSYCLSATNTDERASEPRWRCTVCETDEQIIEACSAIQHQMAHDVRCLCRSVCFATFRSLSGWRCIVYLCKLFCCYFTLYYWKSVFAIW